MVLVATLVRPIFSFQEFQCVRYMNGVPYEIAPCSFEGLPKHQLRVRFHYRNGLLFSELAQCYQIAIADKERKCRVTTVAKSLRPNGLPLAGSPTEIETTNSEYHNTSYRSNGLES